MGVKGEGLRVQESQKDNKVICLRLVVRITLVVVGFWIVIAPLLICRSWRYAYFHFLDHVWFKLQSFRLGSITV